MTRIDRKTLARATNPSLRRLATFLDIATPCMCSICLVEVIVRTMDSQELFKVSRQ